MRASTGRNRARSPGPTAQDVATAAEVSTATVSRAFNAPEKVAPEIREKILRVAAQLGWIPHPAGAALASRRTWLIGVLIPTLDNDVFARQVGALQTRLAQEGITVLIGCSNYDADQALNQVRAMLARGVEALAVVGEAQHPELFETISARGVPYVVTYGWRADMPHPGVGFDNAAAFDQIADHLLSLGHRCFGLIHQPCLNNDRIVARIAGLKRRLAEAGLALRPQHIREGAASLAFGAEALRAILGSPGPRPTAIICGNDTLAIGALSGAKALGLAVPGDLSITGFDDTPMAAYVDPPLTTSHVDTAEIGRLAADYLLARLAGLSPLPPPPVVPELKPRGSTGPV